MSSHDACLARKRSQYAVLVAELRLEGWQVHAHGSDDVHILLLGTCATVYASTPAVLSAFGLHKHAIPPLLRALHLHAVKFAAAILSTRRELERDPAQVCIIPPPSPLLLDPP